MKKLRGLMGELGFGNLEVLKEEYEKALKNAKGKSFFSEEHQQVQAAGFRLCVANHFKMNKYFKQKESEK
jgi:hypothetical protein